MTEAAPAAIPRPDRALVVINPGAPKHGAEEVRAAIERSASRHGIPCRIVEMPKGDHAAAAIQEHVRRAVQEGWERVVVAGGDGTVSMVAQCLARCGDHCTRLGIIAGGTTNVLAKELGLPEPLDDAVAVALESDRSIEIDAICSGERYFWTQVGIGPDARMIRETSDEERRKLGRLAYVISFVRRIVSERRRRFRLEIDGSAMRARAWQLIVANVGTAGGTPSFTWGPKIDPTDGVVELCVYDMRGLLDHVRVFWRVMTGRHRQDQRARFFRVHREVRIESDFPTLVQGDGEVIGRTPITLTIAMHALRIVIAREVEAEAGDETAGDPAESRSPGPGNGSATAAGNEAGTPETLEPEAPPKATGDPAPEPETVAADVETMVAQRSRTWVLQGVLRHPATWIQALDAAIFLRLNNLMLGTALDRGLEGLSRLMHYGEGWVIAVLAMMAVELGSGLRATAEALPVLWLTMVTVNFPLKSMFRRRRPFLAYVKARVLGPKPRDFSFPSGHSAAAFGGAVLLGAHAPGWAPAFYAIASLVGFSRVYLGVHYPSDVVIGGLAGALLAIGYRALLRLAFPALG